MSMAQILGSRGEGLSPSSAGSTSSNWPRSLRNTYDLWGDTVNTASRMESHGVPGHIQVTERVRGLLADRFVFRERGTVEVKGKGPMRTYFLVGRPPGPSPV
jgi:class 3 adenylate cyclase